MTNKYEAFKSRVRNTALAGLVALGLGGCDKNPNEFERKEVVNGMGFRAFNAGIERFVQIDSDTSIYNGSPTITAHGFGKEGWREIYLDSIRGNTPLSAYLNVDSLDAVYNRLAEHAKLGVDTIALKERMSQDTMFLIEDSKDARRISGSDQLHKYETALEYRRQIKATEYALHRRLDTLRKARGQK